MERIEAPQFDHLTYSPTVSRPAIWLAENVPWKTIRIGRLRKKISYEGWAHDRTVHYFIEVPCELIQQYNVIIEHQERQMTILQGATPLYTRYKRANSMELLAGFEWAGM